MKCSDKFDIMRVLGARLEHLIEGRMAFPARKRRQNVTFSIFTQLVTNRKVESSSPPRRATFLNKNAVFTIPNACGVPPPRADCPSSVRVLGKPSPGVELGMNFQAYCFACEKRVSALTLMLNR